MADCWASRISGVHCSPIAHLRTHSLPLRYGCLAVLIPGRSMHLLTASMVNRRAGWMVAKLTCPSLAGPVCPGRVCGAVASRVTHLASHPHQDPGALRLPGGSGGL